MANVLSDERKQQGLALARLGWWLRGIEQGKSVSRKGAKGAEYAKENKRPLLYKAWRLGER
jgi:hypothetical protein